MNGIHDIANPEVKEYTTNDIGVAAYLDHWIGGVQVRKLPNNTAEFFLSGTDIQMHKISSFVEEYHSKQDGTPAKAFREHYKQLAILLGRTVGNNRS